MIIISYPLSFMSSFARLSVSTFVLSGRLYNSQSVHIFTLSLSVSLSLSIYVCTYASICICVFICLHCLSPRAGAWAGLNPFIATATVPAGTYGSTMRHFIRGEDPRSQINRSRSSWYDTE